MARVIGFVKSLQNGTFFAKDEQGAIRELKAGDQVFQNELVYGSPNNPQNAQVTIDVALANAKDITLSGSAELYTDLSIIGGSFEKEEAIVSQDAVESAWKLSTGTPNLEGQVDAPAAGLEETAAGAGVTDTERPGGTLFDARTGGIGDVNTLLNQNALNGGTNQDPLGNGIDTPNLNDQPIVANVTETVFEARYNPLVETGELTKFSGQLVATDADVGDTHTFFYVEGSLSITLNEETIFPSDIKDFDFNFNPDGTYTISGDFNSLAVGENPVVEFKYYAVDNGIDVGAPHESLPATAKITITGTNDQPVAVADVPTTFDVNNTDGVTVSAYYDGYDSNIATPTTHNGSWGVDNGGVRVPILGTIPDGSDIDGFYRHDTIVFDFDEAFGSAVVNLANFDSNDNGSWTAHLKDGSTIEGTFNSARFVITGTDIEKIEITASESNDSFRVESITTSPSAPLEITENAPLTIDVLANDYDQDAHDSLIIYDTNYEAPGNSTVTISEDFKTLEFNPGTEFDYLGVGETATVSFQYRVDDQRGFGESGDTNNEASISEWATVTFTVIGTNDQPVIEVANAGNLTELNGPSTLSATGAIAISDADVNDTLAIKFNYNNDIAWSDGDLTSSQVASLRSGFSIITTDTSAPSAAGTWIYTTSQNLDFLGAGETIKLSYNVYAKDDSGAVNNTSSSQVVNITITGTNDQPVAVADSFIVNTFNVNDTDGMSVSAYYNGNANNTASVVTSNSGWGVKSSAIDDSEIDGFLRDDTIVFNINQAFSSAVIKLSNFDGNDDASWVAYNASGAIVTSGTSSQSQFTINGESITKIAITATDNNDDFRVESIKTTVPLGTLENSAFTIDVLANDYDLDTNDTYNINSFDAKATLTGVTDAGGNPVTKGTITEVNGKLVFDPGTDFDYLSEGQTQTVTFTYDIKDNSGTTDAVSSRATVTLIITGQNDAPVIDLDGTTNVVYTESFENLSGVATSGYTIIQTTSFTGDHGIVWTTAGGHNGLEIQQGSIGGSLASDGNYKAELDSDALVKMSTTVTLTEGTATLAFDYKARPGSETDSDMKVTLGDETFTIKGDGTIVGASTDITVAVVSNTTTGWMTVTVNATSLPLGANTLSFEGLGTANSLGAYIDKISLVGGIANDNNYETTFIENGTPVSIADIDIKITDVDDTFMESAIIKLENPYAGDVLHAGAMPSGMIATFDTTGYTLTLSGHATLVDYQNAIKAITYSSTSENPSSEDRLVHVSVNDGSLGSNIALTTVFVIPVNDAPVAVDDSINAQEDTPFTSSIQLDTNDTDVDSTNLSVVEGTFATTRGGTIVIASDGSYTYTPAKNFSGIDTVNYTVSDGKLSDVGQLTINVAPVADEPSLEMSLSSPIVILGANLIVNGSFEDVSGKNGTTVYTDRDLTATEWVPRTEIPGWKLDTTTPSIYFYNGNSQFVPGKPSTSSASTLYKNASGFYGIDGNSKNDSQGIDGNETLMFDLKSSVTTASFDLQSASSASWTAYNANGVQVGTGTIGTQTSVSISLATSFQYVAFKNDINGGGNTDNGFYVKPAGAFGEMPSMEIHDYRHGSVGITDGANYMDLGASPGNTAIYQTLNLSKGTYQLSFDYADKAFIMANSTTSGKMEILWNGNVVATVNGDNATWSSLSLFVDAIDGSNKLAFREIGSIDNHGIAIDNVQLHGVTYTYDLSVTATLGDPSELLGDVVLTGLPAGNVIGALDVTSGVEAHATLNVNHILTDGEIAAITGSVTSTDGDTKTTTSNAVESHKVHGTTGNDILLYDSENIVIDGGAGIDVLVFNANTTIDFSALTTANNPIDNIEVLDLTKANVTLTNLSLQDVVDMTGGSNTLTILGDSGDKVTFDSTLTKTATTEIIGGHTFDVYNNTNASDPTVIVKIEQNINDTI